MDPFYLFMVLSFFGSAHTSIHLLSDNLFGFDRSPRCQDVRLCDIMLAEGDFKRVLELKREQSLRESLRESSREGALRRAFNI